MPGISEEALKRRLTLDHSETVLRRLLREVDWPFLGLFGEALNTPMHKAILDSINVNPSVVGFVRHLELYPALFSIFLCRVLMQTFGQTDHFQLWPEIRKALRLNRPLNTAEQDDLWLAFRAACVWMGLEVSPRTSGMHYRVDEFLRQVGLSVAFSGDLAKKMLSFARRNGLPDEDDPQGIVAWQEALCRTLYTPFSVTAREAVELDRHGYYTQVFLRVTNAGGQLGEQASLLEQAFAEALQSEGGSTKRIGRAAIPQVMIQNETIGVLLPGGPAREWTVEVDGTRHKYRTSGIEHFIPLDSYLPLGVKINDDAEHRVVSVSLWEDKKNNRILVFSAETGLLRGRGSLEGEPITVSPGAYFLLSRFDLELKSWKSEQLSEDPAIFFTHVQLGPSQRLDIQRGPASLALAATSEALVQWAGQGVVSREGHTVYPDAGLSLRIEVPMEIRSTGTDFDLELSAGDAGQPRRVNLDIDGEGCATVEVKSLVHAANWRPGVWRLLAQLRRKGEARTLARSAALCWIGLKTFRDGLRFVCDARPANLFEAGSDNFQANDKEVGCRDVSRRTMRLVFELDSRREIALTWSVPGVFLDLLEYDDQGLVIRKPLVVGSMLLASAKSSQQLAINSHECATLRLGTFSRRFDFVSRGSITLPIGTLADAITSENSNLEYLPEGKHAGIVLLRLIKPHEVLSFETRLQPGRLMLRFATGNRIDAVQIRAQELVTGAEQTILADSAAPGGNCDKVLTAQMLVTRQDDAACSTTVLLDASSFKTGAWVLGVEVLESGSWGRLTNPRGDYYSAGMVILENGRVSDGDSVAAFLVGLPPLVLHTVLGRFHNAFQYCYAEPCWQSVRWIDSGWRTLIDRCFEQGNDSFGTLLKLVASPLPESTAPSWIPQLTVLSRKPELLALEATSYRVIADEIHPLTKSLSAIAVLPNNLAHAFQGLIHVSVAFSFLNAKKIVQIGEHPNGFDPMRFKDAMRQTDDRAANYLVGDEHFLPPEGHLAGPLHYRFAKVSLEENFARTLGGNAVRRGQALGLAREAERLYSRVQLAGRSVDPVIDPWAMETNESTPDSIAQKIATFRGLERFISVFAWHCRLETRQPGVLNQFLDRARPTGVESAAPLGYILHIGNALLGFYLLLWEIVLRSDLDIKPLAR